MPPLFPPARSRRTSVSVRIMLFGFCGFISAAGSSFGLSGPQERRSDPDDLLARTTRGRRESLLDQTDPGGRVGRLHHLLGNVRQAWSLLDSLGPEIDRCLDDLRKMKRTQPARMEAYSEAIGIYTDAYSLLKRVVKLNRLRKEARERGIDEAESRRMLREANDANDEAGKLLKAGLKAARMVAEGYRERSYAQIQRRRSNQMTLDQLRRRQRSRVAREYRPLEGGVREDVPPPPPDKRQTPPVRRTPPIAQQPVTAPTIPVSPPPPPRGPFKLRIAREATDEPGADWDRHRKRMNADLRKQVQAPFKAEIGKLSLELGMPELTRASVEIEYTVFRDRPNNSPNTRYAIAEITITKSSGISLVDDCAVKWLKSLNQNGGRSITRFPDNSKAIGVGKHVKIGFSASSSLDDLPSVIYFDK